MYQSKTFKNEVNWDLVAQYTPKYAEQVGKFYIDADIYYCGSKINTVSTAAKYTTFEQADFAAKNDAENISFEGYAQ